MSLIVDYSGANMDSILVCHIKQWRTMDMFGSNQLALESIVNRRYANTSLVTLRSNSEEVYQKLKFSVDRGDTVHINFRTRGANVGNDFVDITCDQFREMVPHQIPF